MRNMFSSKSTIMIVSILTVLVVGILAVLFIGYKKVAKQEYSELTNATKPDPRIQYAPEGLIPQKSIQDFAFSTDTSSYDSSNAFYKKVFGAAVRTPKITESHQDYIRMEIEAIGLLVNMPLGWYAVEGNDTQNRTKRTIFLSPDQRVSIVFETTADTAYYYRTHKEILSYVDSMYNRPEDTKGNLEIYETKSLHPALSLAFGLRGYIPKDISNYINSS